MSLTIAHQWRLHALPDSDTHHTTCLFLGRWDQLVLGHSSHYLEGNNEAAPCWAPLPAGQAGSPNSPKLHRATHLPWKMRRKQCKWDQQKIKFIKKKIKIFKNPNLLRVSEGLEDLSVQVVAAVDQIWVIVCQVGWRWRGWALPALKHAFQHRELHQI